MIMTGRYEKYDHAIKYGPYTKSYKGFDNEEGIEISWNEMNPDDIKLIDGGQSLEEMTRALQLVQGFQCEYIIKVLSSWLSQDKKQFIYITEVLSSGSLKKYITDAKVLKLKIVKKWCRHILAALAYLHTQDPPICHGDIKCDNIAISGHTGTVKIGDPFQSIFLRGRSELGTPAFMAPELYGDDNDHRVDTYAFGMCMLEMVTLETPFAECATQGQVFQKVSKGCLPNSLSRVHHEAARRFIEHCLLPADRRASASELLADPFLHDAPEDTQTVAQALLGLAAPLAGGGPRTPGSGLVGAGGAACPSPRSRVHAMNLVSERPPPVADAASPGEGEASLFRIQTVTAGSEDSRVLSLVGQLQLDGLGKQLSLDFKLDEDADNPTTHCLNPQP